ncbi:SDR family NAD(P)-dependent oxidoreductase [Paenibacillus methanolicus]|uniref:Benzil reductase ((S)-benzoin forming) n=1 Tax=Paenibacillus methanolicus TaxID=582686 RepID=A0A5S5CDQ6_9BACL|nr:SDR family NAD(P)-dependent oxidoreductase [Paenibacillus methanolicus]TYP77525.1 benzil reductase ((S)-benzoin forming) [Paenibacillus methanolicus]
MKQSVVLITGASRGIGEALALTLLGRGDRVVGLSRGVSEQTIAHERFMAVNVDLSSLAEAEMAMHRLFETLTPDAIDDITLINNAAALAPVTPIEACASSDIASHLHVSTAAPALLTSLFLQKTAEWPVPRTVVMMTSGFAGIPAASMSLYCASKAFLNMFVRCVREEQRLSSRPARVIAIDPGMAETDMQAYARSREDESFPVGALLRQAHEAGQVLAPRDAAERIARLLDERGADEQAVLRV